MPTQVTNSGVTFNDSTTQSTAVAPADVQIYNSSGTWNKPAGRGMARIMMWGGGGGGGYASGNAVPTPGGGSGGGYNAIDIPLSYLPSSMSVTVGTAGSGATGNGQVAGTGGTSSLTFASTWMNTSTMVATGGGGGIGGYGSTPNYIGGPWPTNDIYSILTMGGSGYAWSESYGGYSGLWRGTSGTQQSAFRNSTFFAGGAGGYRFGNGTSGDFSYWGGSGGPIYGTVGQAGTAPGGGGGGSSLGPSGAAGASGRVIIMSW